MILSINAVLPPHPQLGAFGALQDEHPARPSILSKRSQPKLVSQLSATLAIKAIAANFSFIVDQSPCLQFVAKAINEPFQYKLVFSAASPPVLPQMDPDVSQRSIEAMGKRFRISAVEVVVRGYRNDLVVSKSAEPSVSSTSSIHP